VTTASILLIVVAGVVVVAGAATFAVIAVRSARRERREADAARGELAARYGFELGTQAGPYGEEPRLRGTFEGILLEFGEHWVSEGAGRGYRLITRWKHSSQEPWPGGLVAYTPGFRRAAGGPYGAVHDSSNPVRALVAEVNDLEIGDEELDRALAIDAKDLDVVRALLTRPEVKGTILQAVRTFGHVRIREREAAIEIPRRVRSLQELLDGARFVTSIARGLRD
jgi:hypothetical protein